MTFDIDEIEDHAIVQFGCNSNKLLFLAFVKREKYYNFSLFTPFKYILEKMSDEWSNNPFLSILIQNPNSIKSLIIEFHDYNLLPLPPDNLIDIKGSFAQKFKRYLENRSNKVFQGSELIEFNPTIKEFTTDAYTGESLPPLGVLEESMISDLDLFYIKSLQSNKISKYIELNKITLNEINEIKNSYPVQKINCNCCNKPIPCPFCGQIDLLRGWHINDETIALCYFCGVLFNAATNEIITEFVSDRRSWGARALASVGLLFNDNK